MPKYHIFVSKQGYIDIEAGNPWNAMRIAQESSDDEIHWNNDSLSSNNYKELLGEEKDLRNG